MSASTSLSQNLRHSQNFIKDPQLVARLIRLSSLNRDDTVLEIGPGKGILTAPLARLCCRVIAVEKDPRLAALLCNKFARTPNITIHEGDFLDYRLPGQPYKVLSNIPFNLTSAIVTRLTSALSPPQEAILAMQKDAAEMYLGNPSESLRTILIKPWFTVESLYRFRREDFTPAPRVDVTLLRFLKRDIPLISRVDRQLYRDFLVYAFTGWRPALGETLKTIFTRRQIKRMYAELGIHLDATPTCLTFQQWLELFACFKQLANAGAMHTVVGSEKRLAQQQNKLKKVHRTRKLVL